MLKKTTFLFRSSILYAGNCRQSLSFTGSSQISPSVHLIKVSINKLYSIILEVLKIFFFLYSVCIQKKYKWTDIRKQVKTVFVLGVLLDILCCNNCKLQPILFLGIKGFLETVAFLLIFCRSININSFE
jgi:hypothetical protein